MQIFQPDADARSFRDALGRFVTGVTVVTVPSVDGPIGITANSFSSVSLDPPLVLWSPAKSSRRFKYFEAAPHFAIHVLGEAQSEICTGFAKSLSAFDGLDVTENDQNVPLINGCLARFECSLEAMHDAGDHVIIVGRVERAALQDGAPLAFGSGQYGRFTNGL
ncbi:flavin reductase family protein [Parasulfitobacter algicola]|uniref:Flavin reductase family protein n=1 Tax=Parasulfitobacter algicola TaxID=2614809 RepID=A0ABX2IRC3_9RHOB|nr:flavin reductase family protein [Sulfitobacter algicola]NSX55439.1 flavin reductase family protein [Sulfitobacter algicola]